MVRTLPSPIIQAQITIQTLQDAYPSRIIESPSYVPRLSYPQPIQQPIIIQRQIASPILPFMFVQSPIREIIQTPQLSYVTQSPSGYTCSQNYQITTNIHFNNIYALCPSSSSIFDSSSSNSLFNDNGYSFPSHQYPFQTIVISLKFTGYVQSLSLGSQSNVQRYGLRMFNPLRNVDDTYYSSIDPTTGQTIISDIHLAKVAIRLYINLYTTNDGRPPSNIQLNFNICFDLESSLSGDGNYVMDSPVMIPDRTIYAPEQPRVILQSIGSPVMAPMETIIVEQPQQSLVPVVSTRVVVQESVPVILTIPSNIIQQPLPYRLVDTLPQPIRRPAVTSIEIDAFISPMESGLDGIVRTLPSPIIPVPVIVEIPQSVGIPTFYRPSALDRGRTVVIEEEQPIVLPMPSVVIRTVFSKMLPAPQATIYTLPSSVMETPQIFQASGTISVVEEPMAYQPSRVVYQPNVVIQEQQPVLSSSYVQRFVASPDLQTNIRTIFSPIRTISEPTVDTLPSAIVTAQVDVEVMEDTYPSRIISSPIYDQPTMFERRLPSETLPYVPVDIQKPFVRIIPSPIMLPPTMETDYIVRVPIGIAQTRIETCTCQCPMSGSIPIFYDNGQQSCTIATTRKRRDHHSDDDDDDDCSSPID